MAVLHQEIGRCFATAHVLGERKAVAHLGQARVTSLQIIASTLAKKHDIIVSNADRDKT